MNTMIFMFNKWVYEFGQHFWVMNVVNEVETLSQKLRNDFWKLFEMFLHILLSFIVWSFLSMSEVSIFTFLSLLQFSDPSIIWLLELDIPLISFGLLLFILSFASKFSWVFWSLRYLRIDSFEYFQLTNPEAQIKNNESTFWVF